MHPPIPIDNHGTRASFVFINAWAINRDDQTWKDPEMFQTSKFMPDGEAVGLDLKGGCYDFCRSVLVGPHARRA